MLLALLLFVELGVLLVQFQSCSDHVRRKRTSVRAKKNKLELKSDVLEQEIERLETQVTNIRYLVDS
jgi:CHASE3 domain sensor protein